MSKKGIKSFSLGKELAEWVELYAKEQRVSSSYVIREMLIWLKKESEEDVNKL